MRILGPILLFLCSTAHAQPARITEPIDPHSRIALTGNIPPRAQARFDQGAVEPSFPLEYVTLWLKTSAAQQAALDALLSDQHDPASPQYHHWLTPEQYADRFGVSPGDLAKLTSWLGDQGFTVVESARGRNWITFSGTAAQVYHTFQTEIHRYVENGETHFANATAP
jgi:subtilase family serine protease